MGTAIAGIVIVVVTGALIAWVRSIAARPPSPGRRVLSTVDGDDVDLDLDLGVDPDDPLDGAGAFDVGGDHGSHS